MGCTKSELEMEVEMEVGVEVGALVSNGMDDILSQVLMLLKVLEVLVLEVLKGLSFDCKCKQLLEKRVPVNKLFRSSRESLYILF